MPDSFEPQYPAAPPPPPYGYQPAPYGYQPAPYGYAPPPYGYPPPPGWDPWGTPAPRRRSRTALVVVLVVVALAVAGAVAVVVALTTQGSNATAGRRIVAPSQLGRYSLLNGATSQRIEDMMRSFVNGNSSASGIFSRATVASYAADTGDTPQLLVIMIPSRGAPSSSTGQDAVDQMLAIIPQTQPYDPGPHGGVLSCGATNFGSVDESMCGWSDSSTTGLIVSVNPAQSPSALADLTRQLRALID